jgi:hypothetical protein
MVVGLMLADTLLAPVLTISAVAFSGRVANADEADSLRVVRVSRRWEQSAWGHVIRAHVEGQGLRILKSLAQKTVALRFLGDTRRRVHDHARPFPP